MKNVANRFLSLLVAVVMVLSMVPATAFATTENTETTTENTDTVVEETEETSADTLPNADVSVLAPLTLPANGYMVWPSGDDTIDRPVQIVMNFKANDTLAEAKQSKYGKYKCDFYLSFSGIKDGSLVADGCYLAGNYGSYGWIVIPTDGLEVQNGVEYPVVSSYDANLTYENICDYVKDFTASIYITDEILSNNPDFQVSLALKMTSTDNSESLSVGEPAVYDVAALKNGNQYIASYNTFKEEYESNIASGYAGGRIDTEANAQAIAEAKEALKSLNSNLTDEQLSTVEPEIVVTFTDAVFELGSVPSKVSYDVSPMLSVANSSIKITEFNEAVTFKLPVYSGETRTKANVYHNDDLLGVYAIEEDNGRKFVEVSSAQFSNFTVEPVNGTEPATEVATLDELQAALEDNAAQIVLTADITLDSSISVPDGTVIDLNGKTLYINVENSYYNDVTIKNGSIVLGKDDVHVCDGYFLVNEGKTLVLNGVNVSSSSEGIKCYAVFHLKTGANLDLIDCTLDIAENEYSASYVVYAGESTATVDITGTTLTAKTNGIVHATTVIEDSQITIEAVEHGINRSGVTIDDSTVTISGGTGRGITAQHGDLVITGNSVVDISNMGEATIELRNDKNLNIADTAKVTVDVAVNNTTDGTITGEVTIPLMGNNSNAHTGTNTIWGQANVNASESMALELYCGDTLVGTTVLVQETPILDGSAKDVTWNFYLTEEAEAGDGYWETTWESGHPNVNAMPDKVVLYLDGEKVDEDGVLLSGPDSINKVYAAISADGVITGFATTLQAAVDAADCKTVSLLRDVALTATLKITSAVSLDLNGKTITSTAGCAVQVSGGNQDLAVKISNGYIVAAAGSASNNTSALSVYDGADVTVENVELSGGYYGVKLAGYFSYPSEVTLNNLTSIVLDGGSVTADNAAIIGLGAYPNTQVDINGTTVTSNDSIAIYHPSYGTLNITDGKITGTTAIYLKAGNLNISGGEIIATGEYADYAYNYSGANATGDAVVIESCNYGGYPTPVVSITGGTFTSANNKAVASYNASDAEAVTGFISGGSFNTDVSDFCVEGFEAADEDGDGIYEIAEKKLSGTGTEEDPFLITSLEELKWFRDDVNAGNTYSGEYVKLTADIDLNNEDWTPIGSSTNEFQGSFDGGSCTVSNLYINDVLDYYNGGESYVGLFGYIKNGGYIKNLNIVNADVTGCLYVGAVVGRVYIGGVIENCHVSGNIDIEGCWYVGGIAGRYEYATGIYNCSVKGTAENVAAIEADVDAETNKDADGSYVGGIVGFTTEPNPVVTISGNAVEYVKISGMTRVGGISGIAHSGNVFENNAVSNVGIYAIQPEGYDENDADTIGLIAGACQGTEENPVTFTNCTATNTTAYLNGEVITVGEYGETIDGTTPVTNYKVAIGTKNYETLAEALEAAQSGDTVTLLTDVTLTSKLIINKAVTIDGNGYSIIADANTLWYTTSGKLQIKNYYPWVVLKTDGIALENVVINSNNCAGGVKVENAENVVFDDVSIIGAKADALTVVGSVIFKTYLKIDTTSSVIDARSGVVAAEAGTVFDMTKWAGSVSPVTNDLKGAVDTEGNPFFCAYGSTTYYTSLTSSSSYSNLTLLKDVELTMDTTISGTLDLNGNKLSVAEGKIVKITNDTTVIGEGTIDATIDLAAGKTLTAPEGLNVVTAEGYKVIYADGKYTSAQAVAMVNDTYYTTLEEAVQNLTDGCTLTLLADVEMSEILVLDKVITLDGNGKTLTSTADRAINVSCEGEVAIKNLTIVTTANTERAINVIQKPATLTVENVTAEGFKYTLNVAASSVGSNITVNGGKLSGYAAINIAGGNTVVTVNDAELIGVNDAAYHESNAFGVIGFNYGLEGISVTVNGGTLTATSSNGNRQFIVAAADSKGTVKIAGAVLNTVNGDVFNGDPANVSATFDAACAELLIAQGFVVSEPVDGMVTIEAAAEASYNGVNYAELSAALNAAYSAGGTVKLLNDCKLEDMIASVPAGVTLDLNGNTLEVNNIWSFGQIVDGTVGGEGALIANGNVILDENNKFLPLYDTVIGGYRFYSYGLRGRGVKVSGSGDSLLFKYGFAVDFDNADAYLLMKDTANSGLKLKVDIKWTDMPSGKTVTYTVSDATVADFAENAYEDIVVEGTTNTTSVVVVSITGLSGFAAGTEVTATMNIHTAGKVISTGASCTGTIEGE